MHSLSCCNSDFCSKLSQRTHKWRSSRLVTHAKSTWRIILTCQEWVRSNSESLGQSAGPWQGRTIWRKTCHNAQLMNQFCNLWCCKMQAKQNFYLDTPAAYYCSGHMCWHCWVILHCTSGNQSVQGRYQYRKWAVGGTRNFRKIPERGKRESILWLNKWQLMAVTSRLLRTEFIPYFSHSWSQDLFNTGLSMSEKKNG